MSCSIKTQELLDKARNAYVPVYSPREMIPERGEGCRLWDIDGKEYIDFGAGIAVSSLGHSDPDVVKAIQEQAAKLLHTSNVYLTEPTAQLAEALVKSCFADRLFFSNSGGEANEAAIKIARKYASQHHGSSKREIITFTGSFHGRTLATVTATAQPKYQKGYEPLPGGFSYCAFNDIEAIEAMISEQTCAVMLEPLQGEGGIIVPQQGYLQRLRELCDQYEALLICDEIQCGLGRTGKLFMHEWEGVRPDIMTIAKPLGAGLPIGAMLCTEKVAQAFTVGDHGSTFGGNPVAAAAALVVIEKIQSESLLANVAAQGEKLQQHLHAINDEMSLFSEIRGKGLMIGAELVAQHHGRAKEFTEVAREEGVLILQAGPNVLRFVPPLTLNHDDLEAGMQRVQQALRKAV